MLFSSMEFVFVFLPIVMGVNLLLRGRARNYWLLLCSLLFYAWGEPSFVLVMIGSILLNYLLALAISRQEGRPGRRKALLILDIVCNLSLLFVFKYLNFVTRTVRGWFPALVPLIPETSIALPIGISFFTFQALSYVIDVYRGVKAQKNPAYLGLYISLFPQLIAGPIVRYTTVADQIEHRKITAAGFSEGCLFFLRGFNKKILLANVLSELADLAFGSGELTVGMAWLGALCYMLQIYFDFGGYSEMAIGLGKMLGFEFEKNFDYPYISGTVTEFWRRWHISLGSWFRDYVYFPLGGSRVKSKALLVRNLFVVWLLTGIWHGAEWTFLLWGLMYGALITAEKLNDLPRKLKAPGRGWERGLYRGFTLLVVLLGWVLFRAENLGQAGAYLQTMFGLNGRPFADDSVLFYLRDYRTVLAAGILCATPIFRWLREKISGEGEGARAAAAEAVAWIFQLALFLCSVGALLMGAHNPFIYFNF
ncbi:MAG: MBOAT family protein [Clostridia bacterium]|nr:MBOAT family protein [Clostridia bacterium]